MKRSSLTRKTPLGGGSWLRRTPIAAVSAKRARENRVRTVVLAPLRAEQPWCARCGRTGVGLDAHELLSRARGGSVTDRGNIVLLCREPCHRWVTENPAAAEAEGWSRSGFGAAS